MTTETDSVPTTPSPKPKTASGAGWLGRLVRPFRNLLGRRAGYGGCLACGDTWSWKKNHVTHYTTFNGCFPLCEECWAGMTIDERLHYYRILTFVTWEDRENLWPQIERAVKEGL
jgi:hypothetical protein